MAESNKNIDELFREKLVGHSEMPTNMAWERIQERLDQKRRKAILPWMRIAATLLMMGLGLTFIYYSLISPTKIPGRMAQKEVVPDTKPGKIPALEVLPERLQEEIRASSHPTTEAGTEPEKMPTQAAGKPPLDAALTAEVKSELPSKQSTPLVELKSLDLPPLDMDLLVADGGISLEEEEEVAYKITIVSNGLRPRKDNLVDEIENKIGKLGGLLNKVDREFGELQDTKNNLFASFAANKKNSN